MSTPFEGYKLHQLSDIEQERYNHFVDLLEKSAATRQAYSDGTSVCENFLMEFFKPVAKTQGRGTGHLEWEHELGWDETLPPFINRASSVALNFFIDLKATSNPSANERLHKRLCWLVVRSFELGL